MSDLNAEISLPKCLEVVSRYLEPHHTDLNEQFLHQDVQWSLRDSD